jgi:hypothetical protein
VEIAVVVSLPGYGSRVRLAVNSPVILGVGVMVGVPGDCDVLIVGEKSGVLELPVSWGVSVNAEVLVEVTKENVLVGVRVRVLVRVGKTAGVDV